jgi:serine/threonine protein kinase
LSCYQTALELPAERRREFLESTGADPEVVEKALRMLEALEQDQDELAPGTPAVDEPGRAGTTAGHYDVVAPLGQGGMGEVYIGWDTALDRTVALKFLRPERAGVPAAAARFVREAKAASALNHPNIVVVHEVIQTRDAFVIVMEFVEGRAARKLCGAPVPLDTLLSIGRQTAMALAAAHAHGIIHRDVKPENIMVRTDGYVKLLDFGLARRTGMDESSTGGLPAGTLRYMSPEQIRGEPPGPASDIFSLGLVLHELAAGRHPYADYSTLDGAVAIVSQPVPDVILANPSLPERLASLIGAMLSKQADRRPTAAEVVTALRAIEESLAIEYTPAPGHQEPGFLWKHRIWLAGVIALLGLGVYSSLFWPGDPRTSKLPELRSRPLTSNTGWEESPALSPDGESVAFTWTQKLTQRRHIYIKRLNGDAPVQLTNLESVGDIGPLVWSPDGNRIAFKIAPSAEGPGAIHSIPKQGGKSVKLVDLFNANFSSSLDWSPDGSRIVFSDALATDQLVIYSFHLNTREKRKLTSPPAGYWGDWDPKFSPDGKTLAFKRVRDFWADSIFLMPAEGGLARRATGELAGIWGHAWLPSGDGLIVSTQRNGSVFGIWRFPLTPGPEPVRIFGGGLDAITPASRRGAGWMAWVNRLDDTDIHRISITGEGAPTELIASTRRDEGSSYSPDGRIAFRSDRSGSWEIWITQPDGSGPVRATDFGGPLIGPPRWSPDGRNLAFELQTSDGGRIFVLECPSGAARCGEPVPLTAREDAGSSTDSLPSWSADSTHVYFRSNRSGRNEVWKQALAGGAPVQVTRNRGYASHESRDGKWLYFSKLSPRSLWRMPGSRSEAPVSSEEKLLIGPPVVIAPVGWALSRSEILFSGLAGTPPLDAILGYHLGSGKIRTVLIPARLSERGTDLAVSPDSRWLLYTQLDRSGSNIIVAEASP